MTLVWSRNPFLDKTATYLAVLLASSSGYIGIGCWYEGKAILRLTETCTVLLIILRELREEALVAQYWEVVDLHNYAIQSRAIDILLDTVSEDEYETTIERA